MAEIGLAASIITLIQISQAVITHAYEYGLVVRNAVEDIQGITAEVEDTASVLTKLQDLAAKAEKSGRGLDSWPTLVSIKSKGGSLSQCSVALDLILVELTPAVDTWAKVKERAYWPQKSKRVKSALQVIRLQKASFIEALNIEQVGQVLETGHAVADIVKAQAVARQERDLEWLSSINPSTNHSKARMQHEATTGSWFVESEDFKKWKEDSHSFFWLHGIPGCGKTILSSTIIEEVMSICEKLPSHAFSYFYFDFNDSAKQQVENLLRCIIKQLCFGREKLSDMIEKMHIQHGKGRALSLQTLLAAFVSALDDLESAYIIIDALDECTERDKLLDLLIDIAERKIKKLHVLVTSRKERGIQIALDSIVLGNISLDSSKVDDDITLHVRQRIKKSRQLNRWSDEVKLEIETTLVDGAHGMFRWVHCQLETLSRCLTLASLRKALKQLPRTLDETYERILQNIPEEYSGQANIVLRWLASSERPMYIEEVAEAAIMEPGLRSLSADERLSSPDDILEICSSLVTTTISEDDRESRRELRFAHFSVKEYVLSDRIQKSAASGFAVIHLDAHYFIGEVCTCYLLLFKEPSEMSDNTLEEYPLLGYAAEYWHKHVKEATFDGSRGTPASTFELFRGGGGASFMTWLKVFDPDDEVRNWKKTRTEVASPLYYASLLGLTDVVRSLIQEAIHIDLQGGTYATALQAASKGGHEDVARLLLEAGADVNALGGESCNPLHAAAECGHEQVARLLIENGADVNSVTGLWGFCNILGAACYGQNEQIVRLLLEKGANVNFQDPEFDSNPLESACSNDNVNVVKILLDNGADIRPETRFFPSALEAAAGNENEAIVRLLLERVDGNSYKKHFTAALHGACGGENEQIVRLLVAKGADITANSEDDEGNSLHVACASGQVRIVQLLLELGADPNSIMGSYGSPLVAAAFGENVEIVRLLLEAGADVNFQGDYGNALMTALGGGEEEIVMILLEAGADIHAEGGEDGNALQAAARGGNESLVRMLLEKGMDINLKGGTFVSALHAAASFGKEEVVKLLLEKGADINTSEKTKGNALYAACEDGYDPIARLLLEKGADVNIKGGYNDTPLQVAASNGYGQTVRLLIEKGADTNAQGGKYGTALIAASANDDENEAVVTLLLEHGADINSRKGDMTALSTALDRGSEAVTVLLIENGADITAKVGKYENALQAASSKGWGQTVRLLVARGADINAQGGIYGTALQAAVVNGNEAVCRVLLDHGANASVRGGKYLSALWAAVRQRQEPIVRLLIERGARVQILGKGFARALHLAAYIGDVPMLRLLVEKGGDVNAQGGRYGNPLQAAAWMGHAPAVKLLLQMGANVNAEGGEHGTALKAALKKNHKHIVCLLEAAE